MHWSEEIAARLIERKPDKEEYVCAAGISPARFIGNFRMYDKLVCCQGAEKNGEKAKFIFPGTNMTDFVKFR